jgi:phosphoserine phosphatase
MLQPSSLPLCVDLDGTLIHGDVLFMSICKLARERPFSLLPFLFRLVIQRAAAKAWLAQEVTVDVTTLPYRQELLDYLRAQKKTGRKIYLVSAANQTIVRRVAEHLKLFDAAYGSDEHTNLKGHRKAAFIKEKIAAHFVYAGDAFADLLVWKEAQGAILCGKACAFKSRLPIAVEALFENRV